MRFYTFEVNGQPRLGVEHKGQLVDLSAAHTAFVESQGKGSNEFALPTDMLSFLKVGAPAMRAAQQTIAFVSDQSAETSQGYTYSFEQVRLLAPVPRPGKMLYSGINYRGHLVEEPGAKLPETPRFFSKMPTAVIGPGQPIVLPKLSQQVDYEVELALIIGQTARNLDESQIMDCVAGYTIAHDVSARDVQFKDNQETLGKGFDTFAPMGPCLVTKDEIPEPSNLRLRTLINGVVLQDSSTSDWVFPLPHLLASLNRVMTLEPGDVVTTGCPAGVGYFRHPQIFLKPGDVCVLEIEGIGRLENPVIAEE